LILYTFSRVHAVYGTMSAY